jgi:hypothetical protein
LRSNIRKPLRDGVLERDRRERDQEVGIDIWSSRDSGVYLHIRRGSIMREMIKMRKRLEILPATYTNTTRREG